MDIKKLILWSWNHKWSFVISVAICGILGVFYYFSTPYTRDVRASIMLRVPDLQTQQGEMMSIMGADTKKSATNEIEILTSRDLMEQIVDSLHLTLRVVKRNHLRWEPVFPCPEFALEYEQPVKHAKTFRVKVQDEKYRITVQPRLATIDKQLEKIEVNRLTRESQVITLKTSSNNPQQAVAILNMLLDLYSQVDSHDKLRLAVQTQAFLEDRLQLITNELNEIEISLENYKMEHQITNLDNIADNYRTLIDDYQIEQSDISLQLREYDRINEQLSDPEVLNNEAMIYAHLEEGYLYDLLQTYNMQVARRQSILSTAALSNNPTILSINDVLAKLRVSIERGSSEARRSLQVKQQYISDQINKYSTFLAQLPEVERTFLIMQREKQTKEEQYLFLIEKKEENALALVSSAMPIKVIEHPQMAARAKSPRISKTGMASIIAGLLIPLLVFCIRKFKEEFLDLGKA